MIQVVDGNVATKEFQLHVMYFNLKQLVATLQGNAIHAAIDDAEQAYLNWNNNKDGGMSMFFMSLYRVAYRPCLRKFNLIDIIKKSFETASDEFAQIMERNKRLKKCQVLEFDFGKQCVVGYDFQSKYCG